MNAAERGQKLLLRLGWHHPFFLPTASKTSIMESDEIETACINLAGVIRINPSFAQSLSDEELSGVMAHELCHLMLLHHARQGQRDMMRWNIATDKAINEGLRQSKIKLPAYVIYPGQNQNNLSAEEMYEDDEKNGKGDGEGMAGNATPAAAAGCGVEDTESGEGQGEQSKALSRQWREAAAQAQHIARGSQAGSALAKILEVPKCRVRYEQILRKASSQAVHAHGQDDINWNKRGRRSPQDGPQFPGGMAFKARAAVVIDTSGSMSDSALASAVANTIKISQVLKLKIFIVTHDHIVHFANWSNQVTAKNLASCLVGRGGTDFQEAYKTVERVGGKFDFMIHLTDGECSWPAKPLNVKNMIVALLGSKYRGEIPSYATVIDAEV